MRTGKYVENEQLPPVAQPVRVLYRKPSDWNRSTGTDVQGVE